MPGETKRIIYMLGVGKRELGKKIRDKYSDISNVDQAFKNLKSYWDKKLNNFQCKTPHEGLNTMINIWNPYQAETCVVWSRFASFVEVGGRTGLGFRDTAQDSIAIPHSNPKKTRQRIVELLRGQTKMGYGLHLFNPEWFNKDKKEPKFKSPTVVPTPNIDDVIHGLEDTCSDDALWLIPTICEYVKETGEFDFFNEIVTFANGGKASVYQHMKLILDFSAEQIGATGICKGLRADWNDCLNLGGGESAMVSFLHHWALKAFIATASYLGKTDDIKKYQEIAQKVKRACEENLWDDNWYIRGITANGDKIGTKDNSEGKVHLESNVWAVISDVATKNRGLMAMDSVNDFLFSEYGLHLVSPAYSEPDDDIGFVTRVYKGIKENGAIFSHPNPWAWIAECKLGRGDRAMKFYDSLLPYRQNDEIEVREAEPYSYCQFVIGKDHAAFGRARHPWLTGTAGWAYTAVTKWMLGIRLSYTGIIIDPCIPSTWEEFSVTRKWRNAKYNITVKNPNGVEKGIHSITLNGKTLENEIPQQAPGTVNNVSVIMG